MNKRGQKSKTVPTSSCAFLRAPSSQWYHAHQVDAVMRLKSCRQTSSPGLDRGCGGRGREKEKLHACIGEHVYFFAAAFLGVAFFAGVAFLALTVFATFWGADDLTTRPVLVFVIATASFSSTAGA
jgi:hypothetical protein